MDIQSVARAIEQYQDHASESDIARLNFFKGILEIQQQREGLVASDRYEAPSSEDALEMYRADQAYFTRFPVEIDSELFVGTCEVLAAHLVEHAGLDEEVAKALAGFDWHGFVGRVDLVMAGSAPAQFIEDCLVHIDELGVPSNLPVKIVMMVVAFGLRPHLEAAAKKAVEHIPSKRDPKSHGAPVCCPVCGSPASAGILTDSSQDGQGRERIQYCATCGTQWAYERIRCGVCGEKNQSKLRYVNAKDDRAHRLLLCDTCGEYERIVSQDDLKVAPLVMEVEDVVMASLDQMAHDPKFIDEVNELK